MDWWYAQQDPSFLVGLPSILRHLFNYLLMLSLNVLLTLVSVKEAHYTEKKKKEKEKLMSSDGCKQSDSSAANSA